MRHGLNFAAINVGLTSSIILAQQSHALALLLSRILRMRAMPWPEDNSISSPTESVIYIYTNN